MLLLPLCAVAGADAQGWRTAIGESVSAAALTDAERAAAATATANGISCAGIRPFYWEIGGTTAVKASGSVNSPDSTTTYGAKTPMPYTSASKWFYAAYVAEVNGGAFDASDIKFMTLRSGYHSLFACTPWQTVDQCLEYKDNGTYDASADGKFSYDGGHFQKHASLFGLGSLNPGRLGNELKLRLGSDIAITFTSAQPAGGAKGSPRTYALFLRKLMTGQLLFGSLLGSSAVCTNPRVCPAEALFTPIPETENWTYSLGHWVESDPVVGDGSFSSPGVSGFYPWIDASRSIYGIVARVQKNGVHESVDCGRLIRKAWFTAVPH